MKKIWFFLFFFSSLVHANDVLTKDQAQEILNKFQCSKAGVGINGGAGEDCLQGLLSAVVVIPSAVLAESHTPQQALQAHDILTKMGFKLIRISGTNLLLPLQ